MPLETGFLFFLIAAAVVFVVSEKVSFDVTALIITGILMASGILTRAQRHTGLPDDADDQYHIEPGVGGPSCPHNDQRHQFDVGEPPHLPVRPGLCQFAELCHAGWLPGQYHDIQRREVQIRRFRADRSVSEYYTLVGGDPADTGYMAIIKEVARKTAASSTTSD